jgi:hypothetical protein
LTRMYDAASTGNVLTFTDRAATEEEIIKTMLSPA